ncbi:Cdc6/Cdc18 family protein [Halorussus sp. AFM4]|uniref:Cdc6/Cdc18 family protein n=1 Tax=Halorussus sp. AFM4 TaxID=3421651 RepID=UPI003EBC42F8
MGGCQADQLKDILARRAVKALRDTRFTDKEASAATLESDVLSDDVIPLCAAFAAQDSGDARQALRLLSKACETSKQANEETVTEEHVRHAKAQLERDRVGESIRAETTQRKLALLTVVAAARNGETPAETSDLYDTYLDFSEAVGTDTLIEHTFREKLNDLEHSGLLEKDRHGRGRGRGITNTYALLVDVETALENLANDEDNRFRELARSLRS